MTALGRAAPLDPSSGWPPETLALLARCAFGGAGSSLTCAVSGGPDSLALLALARAAGLRVHAVHVDHGARPGSERDADVVIAAAQRFGATVEVRRLSVPAGSNFEARARTARFAVLPPDVVTGHTMDDQAETVLLNLLRGAGLDGAAAMEPGPKHPLLSLRRSETGAYCAALGLEPVRDPTNDDPVHLRNRVRNELLPLCSALARRDPVPLLARHAALVRDELSMLDLLVADAVPDPADTRALKRAPRPLARRALRRWLREEGATAPSGGRDPGAAHPPSFAEVNRVLAVVEGDARGTELSGGHRVERTKGRLVVKRAGSGKVTPVETEEAALVAPAWAASALGPIVVSEEDLATRVSELGAQITVDYSGDPPLLVGVLKGAMLFMSDLCRAIELPVDVDFMAVSSYGSATRTSGVVRIVKDLDAELTGRHVLVVEDIIDSGLTLNYLRKYLKARDPASLEVCALLVKEGMQRVPLDLRYVGFTIPSSFVVGYGLDVDERYRNLRGLYDYRADTE